MINLSDLATTVGGYTSNITPVNYIFGNTVAVIVLIIIFVLLVVNNYAPGIITRKIALYIGLGVAIPIVAHEYIIKKELTDKLINNKDTRIFKSVQNEKEMTNYGANTGIVQFAPTPITIIPTGSSGSAEIPQATVSVPSLSAAIIDHPTAVATVNRPDNIVSNGNAPVTGLTVQPISYMKGQQSANR